MKLSKMQNDIRKEAKRELKEEGGLIFSFPEFNATVLIIPTCRGMANVTWSLCSHNDEFSRKFGEHNVLSRHNCGIYLPIFVGGDSEADLFYTAEMLVENLIR